MKKLLVSLMSSLVLALTFLAIPAQLEAQKRKPHCDAVYWQVLEWYGEEMATEMYYSCYANS